MRKPLQSFFYILCNFGDDVTVIYHDNYYRRRDDMTYEERTKVNYDHPSALETELLVEHLKKLKERGRDINSGMNDVAFDVMRTKIETLLKE